MGGIEALMGSLGSALSASGQQIAVFADHDFADAEKNHDSRAAYPIYRYSGLKPWRRRKKARDILQFSNGQQNQPLKLISDTWKSLEHLDCRRFTKVLCLAHGTEIPLQPAPHKKRRIINALSKATCIIANSNYTADRLHPFVEDPGKIRMIPPGIDAPEIDEETDRRIARQLSNYQPVLITLARIEQRKGQHSIIKVLPRIIKNFPKLLYVVAGEGSCKQSLESLVRSTGLKNHVLFTGRLDGPEKTAYLKNSDLYIMPGSIVGEDVEGFGMAFIEAAILGIPAIASDAGGSREAVLDKKTGLICRAGDINNLEETLAGLLQNKSLIDLLGTNARKRATSFLWANKIKEYLELLAD